MFENEIPDVIDLFATVVQLREGGVAETSSRSAPAEAGLWTVTALHAENDRAVHSDVWERHPSGQEMLCALSGALHVYLRDHADGEEPAATLTPGRCFLVPTDRWHRLAIKEPGDLLVITPRVDTAHEKLIATTTGGRDEH